jgi:5-methyltetrahydropteroyltriglutamate--homocysteine methyltransferase
MVLANNLGFPRIGQEREFKFNTEKFWKGELNESQLKESLASLRAKNWQLQKKAGIDLIPSNDFSYYDQVLDLACLLGVVPERYKALFNGQISLELYYSMARGNTKANLTALEMTKWFDTNYHYLVPEFSANQEFKLSWDKPFAEFTEAKNLGIITKPVLLGPVSFLSLGKEKTENFNRFDLLENLVKVYAEVLVKLSDLGAEWIQIDEPCLVMDLSDEQKKAYQKLSGLLKSALPSSFKSKLLLTTYFEGIENNINLVDSFWDGLHVDLVRSPQQFDLIIDKAPKGKYLSLGLIDGRNIWKNNLNQSIELAKKALSKIDSEHLMVAGSCSLLHSPLDLSYEAKLKPEIKEWLAFANDKLTEINIVKNSLNSNLSADEQKYLTENQECLKRRQESSLVHIKAVKDRVKAITDKDLKRNSVFEQRQKEQKDLLKLPLFPTTTIGSFPQTTEVRQARAKFKKSELSSVEYDKFIREAISESIKLQEEIEMDVLVHGEFERNDMVEYFGEYLTGFTTTQNGWVQSYGTRCVKPPIIYGDISRISAMTVEYTQYAQSLTKKPVKGMLTGPITILQWSFVRNDQARSETANQIGLAILDEVLDLEKVGIKVIQIDEPAFREGLPLRNADKANYLNWAVNAFRLSSSAVEDTTQIHTHMCYSEFNDIINNIADMDADVITIETSRSQMELLNAFEKFEYPNEVGPGVYDIHSPRIPTREEMVELIKKASKVLPKENIWVNPDCGLKTRAWEEVKPSLVNMIQAAKELRKILVKA